MKTTHKWRVRKKEIGFDYWCTTSRHKTLRRARIAMFFSGLRHPFRTFKIVYA